jgi:aryl carrier-like protein
VYHTGDRGRYQPAGQIEILGRCDQQVKIRGVRVEPDELSAALCRHPQVNACVVVAHQPPEGEPILTAYVAAPNPPSPVDLRHFLSLSLPSAMIPARFMFLEQLPVTANGKVDRRALPEPAQPAASPVAFVQPQTDAESFLAGVWAEVLNLGQVSVHANFFELGGDSISALQVVARARRQGFKLSARQLFQHQTIADLAQVLRPMMPAASAAGPTTLPGASPTFDAGRAGGEAGAGLPSPEGSGAGEPSFPLAGLNAQDLDDLLSDLNDSES